MKIKKCETCGRRAAITTIKNNKATVEKHWIMTFPGVLKMACIFIKPNEKQKSPA